MGRGETAGWGPGFLVLWVPLGCVQVCFSEVSDPGPLGHFVDLVEIWRLVWSEPRRSKYEASSNGPARLLFAEVEFLFFSGLAHDVWFLLFLMFP